MVLAFWMATIEVPAVHQPFPVATIMSGVAVINVAIEALLNRNALSMIPLADLRNDLVVGRLDDATDHAVLYA